jgi:hypothetical protein
MEGTLGGRPGRRPRQFFEHGQENDADDFQEKAEEPKGKLAGVGPSYRP